MAVTLLRHTTPDVAKGICYGATDLRLAGSAQTEMEQALGTLTPRSKVISSPLYRCRALADHIAAAWNVEVHTASDWREMDFGTWEGMEWSAIPRHDLDAWADDFHGFDGHGGESVAALETRIRRALSHAPEGALIVTHMGCIKAALALTGDLEGWNAQLPFGGTVTI